MEKVIRLVQYQYMTALMEFAVLVTAVVESWVFVHQPEVPDELKE